MNRRNYSIPFQICACGEVESIEKPFYRRGICSKCYTVYKNNLLNNDPLLKEEYLKKERERYNRDKTIISERKKEFRANPNNRARIILKDSKSSDKKKSLGNDLTLEFIESTIKNGCKWCGEKDFQLTLDRIDNLIGHTQSNCVCACYRCNKTRENIPIEAWEVISKGMREANELGLFDGWDNRINKTSDSKDDDIDTDDTE